ncbi:hypothetical protein ACIB24_17040 [Spongisporangium articulatum]|uniref:Uncharacterized protein n=1 Tax=Spongisporangium articulatum TaxID=3362603 RepID=A0ABW8AQZ9_9ACTN
MGDLQALQGAADGWRRIVEALGVDWPVPGSDDVVPAERLARYYDGPSVPAEVAWLHSYVRSGQLVLPEGTYLMDWPSTAKEAFFGLELAWPAPFPWRAQIPVITNNVLVFTVVLAESHAGEVWRYEIGEEAFAAVRAATDLATLFETWVQVGRADGLMLNEVNRFVQLKADRFQEQYVRGLGVDPFAYPTAPLDEEATRRRQRECGVDMDLVEDVDAWVDLFDEVDATAERLDAQHRRARR